MKRYFLLVRPSQWLKNTFVFIPLVFSKNLFHLDICVVAFLAFISFCAASSTVYIINDIQDREADALHPEKKKRPITSGAVGIPAALVSALILSLISISIALSISWMFTGIIVFYLLLQLAYSFRLKHIVIVDVFTIAIGFMLRVFSGAAAIDVVISHWLIITTMFLSLFLAVSKRRSELLMVQSLNINTKRKVLAEYDSNFLNSALIISATGMAISYSLYTMSERTLAMFGTDYLIYSSIFVLFGMFRYLFLVQANGEGENPVSILVKDPLTTINFIVWFCFCVFIIYFSGAHGV
ncbi:MAG: decaprenyl-phosphate phosphoribosyltransferase [Bacteroidota bacterium]|jgi:4-hydroxybenzoate polyprenyltransferase